MISKFDAWKLRKSKNLPSNKQRLIALKSLLNDALQRTLADTTIGVINHASESNPEIQPNDEEVIEMANAFDKAWRLTYDEWMSLFDEDKDSAAE